MAYSQTLLSVAVGTFFAISGYHKLTNSTRHAGLVATLKADHVPMVSVMQWWVPAWEFISGCSLCVGLFPQFNAMVLSIIMIVALLSEGAKRVKEWAPIDKADVIDDYLYLQETCYLIMLIAIILG